jgi:hypothetical protein
MTRWANIGHSPNQRRTASQLNDIAANGIADPPNLNIPRNRLEYRFPWQPAWHPEKASLRALDEKLLCDRQ